VDDEQRLGLQEISDNFGREDFKVFDLSNDEYELKWLDTKIKMKKHTFDALVKKGEITKRSGQTYYYNHFL